MENIIKQFNVIDWENDFTSYGYEDMEDIAPDGIEDDTEDIEEARGY